MLLHLPLSPSLISCSLALIRRAAILDERLSASAKLPEVTVSPAVVGGDCDADVDSPELTLLLAGDPLLLLLPSRVFAAVDVILARRCWKEPGGGKCELNEGKDLI